MNKRPISVTILAAVYLMVGTVGLVFHFREILTRHAFQYDDALIELVQLIAIACGVFMLQGRNWARWLALAWIGFHAAFSFFDTLQKGAVHSLMLILIAYLLFRPEARTYFQHPDEAGSGSNTPRSS
jgi:hypothetical protein